MEELARRLDEIDGRGYKAYKRLRGSYRFPRYVLHVDHVQGDPFADPSRCRVAIEAPVIGLASEWFANPIRTIALEDFLGRRFARLISLYVRGKRGAGKSGAISIAAYGQPVLQRNAVLVRGGDVELRFQLGLPADGRTVNAEQARIMLREELVKLVDASLLSLHEDADALPAHIDCVETQHCLRAQLSNSHLCAFIADGSILPRTSGVDDRPLDGAVVFQAPESLAVTLNSATGEPIRGLGVPCGVTLIVGGGFHGKSTLLKAIERGVYNHVPGDGRERVVTDPSATKIRAEDGRAITGVDISPFINNLPQGRDTRFFSTANASGSTSQAASIVEILATETVAILIDEDTSATNFMVRDAQMRALVSKDKEPITPLVQRIRELYRDNGVSLVLVMGGSSEFFSVADTVIMMDNYLAGDVSSALAQAEKQGLDSLTPYISGTLAMPRLQELMATVNRFRRLKVLDGTSDRKE